jgi:WD40 repeat protein
MTYMNLHFRIHSRLSVIVTLMATAITFVLVGSCSSNTGLSSPITNTEVLPAPTPSTADLETTTEYNRVSIYQALGNKSSLAQLSLDDQYLAVTPDNNIVWVLKFPSLEHVIDISIPSSGLNYTYAIAFSHDNSFIATGGFEDRVDLFNMETGSIISSIDTEEIFPQSVSISDLIFLPGDQKLIIASNRDNGGIATWSFASHESSRYFSKPVNAIADFACEDRIVASSWPTGIRLETDQPLILLDLDTYQFTEIQVNGVVGSDVQFFDSCSKIAAIVDGVVYIIDMMDSTVTGLGALLGDALAVRMDVSQEGLLVVLASESYSFPSDTIIGPYFESDARYVLSLVDLAATEIIDQIPLVGVTDIDLTADGAYLVIASYSQPVTIWRIN